MDESILIIDDDAATRVFLTRKLQRAGYQVWSAALGAEGIEMVSTHHPALIICDWMMPMMDGIDVCRSIKSNKQLHAAYFILLTARDSVTDRVVGLEAGADEFLIKPVDDRELIARVRTGFRIASLQQQLQDTVDQLEVKVEVRTNEIQTMNAQLLQAMQIKDDFLANVSHELRTPLTSIITASKLLRMQTKDVLSSRQHQYLDIINTSGDHLKTLINDLLDFAKLNTDMVSIQRQPVEVGSLAEQAISIVQPAAQEQQIVLSSILPKELFLYSLNTDGCRVAQILVNLLSNAIKFTPAGGQVTLKVEQTFERIVFEVTDTGIGIPYVEQEHVFERFHQLEPTLTKQYSGTGIGLSLSEQLSKLLGGHILLCSEEGVGSTFRLYLPA